MIRSDEYLSRSAMPRLGEAQQTRLRKLSEGCSDTLIWDKTTATVPRGALVIVPEPISALHADTLINSLDAASVVAIPIGANPSFDPIKARLEAHGMIGADGDAAPHQLWWGGRAPLTPKTGIYRPDGIVLTSCCLADTQSDDALARLRSEIDLLGLQGVVTALPHAQAGYGTWKIDFIMAQLDQSDCPVLWLAPEVSLRRYPILAQSLGCDVAFHRRINGVADPRVMVFQPTAATRALLRVWRRLSLDFPDLPESFVFDQAWILTTAQRPLETAWLPEAYCSADPMIRGATFQVPPPAPDLGTAIYPTSARRFGRPRAPEPLLIIKGPGPLQQPVIVAIAGHREAPPEGVCAAIEAIASAFAADPGGFAQLELVLCDEVSEMKQLMAADNGGWVVSAAADGCFPPETFVQLGRLAAMTDATDRADGRAEGMVTNFISAELRAKARWSRSGGAPLIYRPQEA